MPRGTRSTASNASTSKSGPPSSSSRPKARGKTSRAPSTRAMSPAEVESPNEEEDEEEDELPKRPPAKRASRQRESAAPPSKRVNRGAAGARPSRAKASIPVEEESDPEVEEEEEVKSESDPPPARKRGPPSRSAASTKPQRTPSSASSSSKPKPSAASNGRPSRRKVAVETSESEEEPPAAPVSKSKPASRRSSVTVKKEVFVEIQKPPPKSKSRVKPPPNIEEEEEVEEDVPHVDEDEDEEDEDKEEDGESSRKDKEKGASPARPPPPPEDAKSSSEEEDLIPPPAMRASVAPQSRIGRGSMMPPRHSMAPVVEEPVADTGPKPRLVIHKMALVNFKSYKGRQEIGPFHKSFSAIVGPNGSGKSNTIDALLFVFGYRASKMRQGKLSELIHNSSVTEGDEDPEFDSCSVEVHFREIIDLPGPDAFTVVPNSELVVARTAYMNNSSKYTINEEPSNFTEVTTLLKGRGIDLDHKRFLILQGEVESIAQMKPKAPTEHEDGLLEYLEDIIGTSKYKQPIEECSEEVDRLNEDRGQKLNRLRLVEKEKSSLEAQKREAEDYLREFNSLIRAQSVLAQHYIWTALNNAEISTDNINQLKAKLAQEVEKNKDNVAESEELQAEYDGQVKAYDVVKKETAALVKDLAHHEKEEVKIQEKKKHLVSKQKKLKKSLADDGHAKNEADSTIETLGNQLGKRKAELEELEGNQEKEEAELEVILNSLKDKTVVFQRQIEAKQKDLEPWITKVNQKQGEIDIAESERALLANKAAGAEAAVDEAVQSLDQLKTDKVAKEAELKDLAAERKALKTEIEEAEKQFKSLQQKSDAIRAKASGAHQKVEEAKASQQASTSQNAVLDGLTRLKAAGRIHGFHGRLGSLGTIPDKYDVAISTACPSLNHLVVDTVEQGQACIEYLRKQNIGRGAFLVLSQLPADGRLAKIGTPENVPRLFDLVKPKDPKFAAAFFKGLGNTLVADDLEQANRIAYGQAKRWRVVTLAGQLFDTSGTMSGGGTKVARGGMSSKLAADSVQPAVLKQYEADSGQLDAELETLVEEKNTCEHDLEGLHKKAPQVDMAYSKVELDIRTADKRITEAEKRIKELNAQNKPNAADVKRISSLESEIASSTKEVNKLREKSGAIEADIQSLQDKILEIGGVRLRTQKAKVDGIKEMIDLVNDQITKAEVGKAKAERDSEKLEATITSNEGALEELDAELEEIGGTLAACQQDLVGIRTEVEKAQEIVDSAKEQLSEMKAELDEKMVLINQFRAKEMEISQKLEDAKKAEREEMTKVDHWQKYHDKLELHEIDEDDEEEDESEAPAPIAEGGEEMADAEKDPVKREEKEDGDEEDKSENASPKTQRQKRSAETAELEVFSAEDLAEMDSRELRGNVARLEEKTRNAKPNLNILAEYRRREAEFLKRAAALEDVTATRDAQKARFDELRKTRLEEFMAGFNTISSKLKEMYQMITLGGNAELELVDSLDPFSEGIIFSVMPPKKSWKNISNLSGGEKTLSSLALVFALHVFKPTPLYFMDEIDAALDFRNVSIVANYIKDRTKNAQFIIISLRNDMFELSHRLIGIYKTSNATRSISIDNHSLVTAPNA